jgi:alanyl-tRNA synthetase
LLAELDELKRQVAQRSEGEVVTADSLLEQAETVGASQLIVCEVQGAPPNLMRQLIDQIRKKVGSSAVLLTSAQGKDKVILVAGVSKDLVERGMSAGNWIKETAAVVGGGGGGKPDMAQAGGRQPEKLPEAIEKARQSMRELIGSQA